MLGETEPASLGLWYWPRERASSGLATGRGPPGPWGDGRRQAPGTPSPTDTAESPAGGDVCSEEQRVIKEDWGGTKRKQKVMFAVNIKEPLLC